MGKKLNHITPDLQNFIAEQKIYFVGTAASEGRVNISPKGTDSFRVIDKNTIVWLNLTGSGNETAAHLLKNNRMTIMFCSFEKRPLILRLYGTAKIYHKRDDSFDKYSILFPENTGARQIIEMSVDLVQTSCGFAVPYMEFKKERTTLNTWSEKKGEHGVQEYWKEKNMESIDGFQTKILED